MIRKKRIPLAVVAIFYFIPSGRTLAARLADGLRLGAKIFPQASEGMTP
jgi:hypothetical protein